MPQDLVLELAQRGDATRMASMSRDYVERGLGWSWIPSRVMRRIEDRECITLIARDGRVIAGFAILVFGDEVAHLDLIAVRPAYRRRGIGRRMMQWLEESALVAGIASISLELRAGNRAGRDFYAALGYTEEHVIERYYRGRESAIRMVHDLRVCPAAGQPQLP